MTRLLSAPASLLGLALTLCGCNALNSSADHTIAEQRTAPPVAIVVQPFALSPEDAPPDSAAAGSDAGKAAARFRQSLASHLIAAIAAMGLPAQDPDAALPPAGSVISLEGSFVSVPGGDSADPAIVSLANAWPDVVVDVQIYDTSETGDRLYEDMEVRISDTNPLVPKGEPGGEPTMPATAKTTISPALQAKLDAAAADGAAAIARHLAPFFADQGWIAAPSS